MDAFREVKGGRVTRLNPVFVKVRRRFMAESVSWRKGTQPQPSDSKNRATSGMLCLQRRLWSSAVTEHIICPKQVEPRTLVVQGLRIWGMC